MLPLQDVLRSCWLSGRYQSADRDAQPHRRQPFLVEETSRATVQRITDLMKSDLHWSSIALVAHIAREADRLSMWAEQCPCHPPEQNHPKEPGRKRRSSRMDSSSKTCPLKCCRAPELAVGQALAIQGSSLESNEASFLEHVANAPVANQAELHAAYSRAAGFLWGASVSTSV